MRLERVGFRKKTRGILLRPVLKNVLGFYPDLGCRE